MTFKLSKIIKPFIIAELSANHNGEIKNIYKLIDKAKNVVQVQSKFSPIHLSR